MSAATWPTGSSAHPGPFRGYVVDFLQLPHWPIFNVADTCITTAAVMVVLLSLIKNVGIDGRHPGDKDADRAAPDDAALQSAVPVDATPTPEHPAPEHPASA